MSAHDDAVEAIADVLAHAAWLGTQPASVRESWSVVYARRLVDALLTLREEQP